MKDTGRSITIDFDNGRARIRLATPIHSLGQAISTALADAGLSDFYGSCQITVDRCQLEPSGSATEPETQHSSTSATGAPLAAAPVRPSR